MKIIVNFFKKILDEPKLLLGRWSINYCNNNINKKIDSGNEDHCGPCGQNNLKNINKNKKKSVIKDIE